MIASRALLLLAIVACASQSPDPRPQDSGGNQTRAAPPRETPSTASAAPPRETPSTASAAAESGSGLAGTSWQLVKFQSSDDTTLTPDDRSKYTLSFGTDGMASARIDCNRGRGTWTSSGPNQLQFGPLALTRAACPPGSLHDRIAKDWPYVRSYTMRDGHLYLALMADGGIYEFEPIDRVME